MIFPRFLSIMPERATVKKKTGFKDHQDREVFLTTPLKVLHL
jgi:hypothetical protein